MSGKYTEKISLSVTKEMLESLQHESKRTQYTMQGLLRLYCQNGLTKLSNDKTIANDLADLKRRLEVMESERIGAAIKGGREKICKLIDRSKHPSRAVKMEDGTWEIRPRIDRNSIQKGTI